jgi:hypothetical protein
MNPFNSIQVPRDLLALLLIEKCMNASAAVPIIGEILTDLTHQLVN